MFKAIEYFKDVTDNCHEYFTGDTFPREGLTVSDKRLAELSSDRNCRKRPVIAAVAEPKPEKAKKAEKDNTTTAEKPKTTRSRKKV